MRQRRLLAVVGMMGSGKGTVVEYVTGKYGWPMLYFGGMVYEEVAKRGLDIVKDERAVREDMREKEGPAVLAKRIARKAQELFLQDNDTIVADGLYSWSELQFLAKEFGDELTVIAVVVPKHLRYMRVIQRVDPRRKYKLSDVKARDIQEIEGLDKGGPIAHADYYLLNDDSIEHLHEQIDSVLLKAGFD